MYKVHVDKCAIKLKQNKQGESVYQTQAEDRDAKIAAYKFKKQIEANLDRLKSYKDEAMKREFYKT